MIAAYVVHKLYDPDRDTRISELPDGTYQVRISESHIDCEVLGPDDRVRPSLPWIIGTVIRGRYKGRTVWAHFLPPHEDPTVAKWLKEKISSEIGEFAHRKEMVLNELVGRTCKLMVKSLSDTKVELGIE